jgi:hypothetical protein
MRELERVFAFCVLLNNVLDYSSTLKMDAIHSCEMSVKIYRTTRRHIPEDANFHCNCCEILLCLVYAKSNVSVNGSEVLKTLPASCWSPASLIFLRWRWYVRPKRRLIFQRTTRRFMRDIFKRRCLQKQTKLMLR